MRITVNRPDSPPIPGICGSCTHCRARVTTQGKLYIRCPPVGRVTEPIEQCNVYDPKDVDWGPPPPELATRAWSFEEIYMSELGEHIHVWCSPSQRRQLGVTTNRKEREKWVTKLLKARGQEISEVIDDPNLDVMDRPIPAMTGSNY